MGNQIGSMGQWRKEVKQVDKDQDMVFAKRSLFASRILPD